METIKFINRIVAQPLVWLVVLYQRSLSPDHGPFRGLYPYGFCKFHPTCSMYARSVLNDEGLAGIFKIIRRLSKCRPGTAPAIDLP